MRRIWQIVCRRRVLISIFIGALVAFFYPEMLEKGVKTFFFSLTRLLEIVLGTAVLSVGNLIARNSQVFEQLFLLVILIFVFRFMFRSLFSRSKK